MTQAQKKMTEPKTTHYPRVEPNPDFAKIEEKILAHWQEEDTFRKSVENRPAVTPQHLSQWERSQSPSEATDDAGEGEVSVEGVNVLTCSDTPPNTSTPQHPNTLTHPHQKSHPMDEISNSPSGRGIASSEPGDNHINNEYVFYDGPPFANGLPHYGHLLTGYVKDLFARYHTMKGQRVERRFGWDCHGLPAEMGAEKGLGISGRKAIEDYGIGKFNEYCRSSVMKFSGEWEHYVNRQGRWVDFEGDYKTMDTDFMESVIWAFKQLYDKGLIFESHRVMPYSWAAETPLSNFETKLDNSYREKVDKAVTVKFRLKEVPEILKGLGIETAYLLAWTTTPWTLPSNLALAVNPNFVYLAENNFEKKESIIAIKNYFPDAEYGSSHNLNDCAYESADDGKHQPILPTRDLIGAKYEPLFPYFKDHPNAFRVLDGSDFIEEGSGTGIVHMAPGFGEDDQRVCAANGIDVVVPVDEQGRYTDAIYDLGTENLSQWERSQSPSEATDDAGEGEGSLPESSEQAGAPAHPHPKSHPMDEISTSPSGRGMPPLSLKGLNVIAQTEGKCEDEPYTDDQLEKYGLVNLRIINWLKLTGKLVKQEDYKHNYPHCWRTDTPLIYRAMPSWYVKVTAIRDEAVAMNRKINWIPEHIGPGQMEHMLATAPDWSISRNRFWGTPIPVWRKQDGSGELKVFGSIAELEEFFEMPENLSHGERSQSPSEATDDAGEGVRTVPHRSEVEESALHPHPKDADALSTSPIGRGNKRWLTDLHRPFIDQLTTAKDGSKWQRVSDVFDCWFESGSMPFAQVHYPFENKDWFESHYPADFITEYVGQTRGWFNTLIMMATGVFKGTELEGKPPFKNCICHGVVLDSETGLKYSKRLKNYKNPLEVIDQFGADALRWLMISSPVMRGQDLSVDPEGKFIRDVVRLHIKPIWNAYNFFTLYANADGVKGELVVSRQSPVVSGNKKGGQQADPALSPAEPVAHREGSSPNGGNLMDRYILAKCREAVSQIESALEAYDTPTACAAVSEFFEVLNNWYIRRNKERFWNESGEETDQEAYNTLYTVLHVMVRAAAPLLPYTCEEIYRGLNYG